MKIILSKEEIEKAISRYIGRDVLGVCGEGWKGSINTNITDTFQVSVDLIMPKKEEQ